MNFNEIVASIEELVIKVAVLEKMATTLKSTVESIQNKIEVSENKDA